MKLWAVVLVLWISTCSGTYEGLTLSCARDFSQEHPDTLEGQEFGESLEGLFNPDYQIAYKRALPVGIQRALAAVGLWFERACEKKLGPCAGCVAINELIQKRELSGYVHKHVLQVATKPGDHLILFGDLQGAFGSLVRSLDELERQGIIDDTLFIKKPGYFIIFNSNVIGRGVNSFQTLLLVATLLRNNPDTVFWIRGKYEEEDLLYKYGVGQYLSSLADLCDDAEVCLSRIIRLISTLPLAVYINYDHGKGLLRFSGYGRSYEPINERKMGDFFQEPLRDPIAMYTITHTIPSSGSVHIRVLLQSIDGIDDFKRGNEGLALVDYSGGAIVWTPFSAPLLLHQKINNFFNDAFSIIELGSSLPMTSATLYTHDARSSEPFQLRKRYLLVSGEELNSQQTVEKAQKQQILLGTSLDLSRGVAFLGQQVKIGIMLVLDQANQRGGVHDKRVQCIVRDDGYSPQLARENIDALMKDEHIDIFPLTLGSSASMASLDLLKKGSVLFLFPITGAPLLRSPDFPGVINMRASYRDEVYALIPYLIEKLYLKRFAFFYQNDAYGQGPLEAAREILKSYGITQWTELPYIRNVTDFKTTIATLKESQPEALVFFSTPAATQELLRQVGVNVLASMRLCGLSPLVDGTFDKWVQNLGLHCIFSRIVPDPTTSDLSIAKEYRNSFNEAGLMLGDFSFEAFIGTSLLIEVMRSINGPLTMQAVRSAFEAMKQYSFKGLEFSFDPQSRSLARNVWLDLGNGKIEKISWPERLFREKHPQPQSPTEQSPTEQAQPERSRTEQSPNEQSQTEQSQTSKTPTNQLPKPVEPKQPGAR